MKAMKAMKTMKAILFVHFMFLRFCGLQDLGMIWDRDLVTPNCKVVSNMFLRLKWVEPISISYLHPVVLTNQPQTGNEGHEGYEEKHEEGQWWGGASAKFQKSMAVRLKKEL